MSARDDYPHLARLAVAGLFARDEEAAAALDELDRLRDALQQFASWDMLGPGAWVDDVEWARSVIATGLDDPDWYVTRYFGGAA